MPLELGVDLIAEAQAVVSNEKTATEAKASFAKWLWQVRNTTDRALDIVGEDPKRPAGRPRGSKRAKPAPPLLEDQQNG